MCCRSTLQQELYSGLGKSSMLLLQIFLVSSPGAGSVSVIQSQPLKGDRTAQLDMPSPREAGKSDFWLLGKQTLTQMKVCITLTKHCCIKQEYTSITRKYLTFHLKRDLYSVLEAGKNKGLRAYKRHFSCCKKKKKKIQSRFLINGASWRVIINL